MIYITIGFNRGGIDYIRIDSHKKKLKDFPDTERELWAALSSRPFEKMIAMDHVEGDYVLRLLDYASYFELLSMDLLSGKQGILDDLQEDGMITKNEAGNYDITNLGGVCESFSVNKTFYDNFYLNLSY